MEPLLQDLRTGFRQLIKRPGMYLMAIGSMALGIGLATTMFSLVNAFILRGVPFTESDRLRVIWRDRTDAGFFDDRFPLLDFRDYERLQT